MMNEAKIYAFDVNSEMRDGGKGYPDRATGPTD